MRVWTFLTASTFNLFLMTHTVHFELLKKRIIIFHVQFTACQSFLWKNVNDFRYRIKWCTFNHLICPVQVGESNGEYRMDACVSGVRVDERTTDRPSSYEWIACTAQVDWIRTESCVVFLWSIHSKKHQKPNRRHIHSHLLFLSHSRSHSQSDDFKLHADLIGFGGCRCCCCCYYYTATLLSLVFFKK